MVILTEPAPQDSGDSSQELLKPSFSYAPLAIDVSRFLMRERDRVALAVLQELANCASPRGVCYPSPRYLAELTGYALESVKRALFRLQDNDFIRIYYREDDETGKLQLRYILNPCSTIYVRDEMFESAMEIWGRVSPIEMSSLTKDRDPESPTNISNQHHNQLHNQPHNQRGVDSSKKGNQHHHHQDSNGKRQKPKRQKADQISAEGASSVSAPEGAPTVVQNPSPVSATPPPVGTGKQHPPLPQGFNADQPFADPFKERHVELLQKFLPKPSPITTPNLRRYLARYSVQQIYAAFSMAENDPTTKNLIGKMDYNLLHGVNPSRDGDDALYNYLYASQTYSYYGIEGRPKPESNGREDGQEESGAYFMPPVHRDPDAKSQNNDPF